MARSEPYPCIPSRCPLIEDKLNGTERPRIHGIIRGVCGFLGFRSAPILARISGTVQQISRGQDLTTITIENGEEIKDHKRTYHQNDIKAILSNAGFTEEKMSFGYFECFLNNWGYADK